MNRKQHTLFVCTTCASVWQDGKRVGESGGQQLLQQLQELAQNWELQDKFSIQEVECMSACNHACVIALKGEDKLIAREVLQISEFTQQEGSAKDGSNAILLGDSKKVRSLKIIFRWV